MDTSWVIRAARKAVRARNAHAFHHMHAQQVQAKLRQLAQRDGKGLDRRDKKLCDDYAVDVLGNRVYAPWLQLYTVIHGRFREGWIPDNYYGWIVVPRINAPYGFTSRLRSLNQLWFHCDAFPDLASCVNGTFLDRDHRHVPAGRMADLLFDGRDRVVFKRDDTNQGDGFSILTRDSFDAAHFAAAGNGLFQAWVQQHESLAALSGNAVATLRVTTLFERDGTVSVRSVYLRVGRAHDTHVRPRSNIRIPVDPATGRLAAIGHTPEWEALRLNPDTGTAFADREIPAFHRCIELVKSLHLKTPHTGCIGWDTTVDTDGEVRILEWNGDHNNIKYTEAVLGPCFADQGWERLGRP